MIDGGLQLGRNPFVPMVQQLLPQFRLKIRNLQSGDSAANEVINECAEYLGMSLANLVNLLIPTEFVFDAGEFKNCPILIERAFTSMKKRAYRSLVKDVQILEVTLTDEELLKGMSTTMCNHIFDINFESDLL